MAYDINLPSFLATIWDCNASFTEVLDKYTRLPLEEKHNIVFADARSGYFVAWKNFGNREFYVVNSKDFVIRHYINKEKTDYYDSDEIDYEDI